MKRSVFILLAIALLGLTACQNDKEVLENDDGNIQVRQETQAKRPKIPTSKKLKASALEYNRSLEEETELLLKKIEEEIEQPSIKESDIKRGYYFGSKKDYKTGTPENWQWIEDGNQSRWVSPKGQQFFKYRQQSQLCSKTGGEFVYSCLDTEVDNCQYTSKTQCQCPDGSTWKSEQGCLLIDTEENTESFVEIAPEELLRGFYYGKKHQKKLNTPDHWSWNFNDGKPRWQNTK